MSKKKYSQDNNKANGEEYNNKELKVGRNK